MAMFIVKGEVREGRYPDMYKVVSTKQVTQIVMADNKNEAREKFEQYWNDKGTEYCDCYDAFNVEVYETIGQAI